MFSDWFVFTISWFVSILQFNQIGGKRYLESQIAHALSALIAIELKLVRCSLVAHKISLLSRLIEP